MIYIILFSSKSSKSKTPWTDKKKTDCFFLHMFGQIVDECENEKNTHRNEIID